MAKDGHTKLRIVLPDSDIEGLRHLTKENPHPDGMPGLAVELIQQGLGKRKLGDYIHVEAHEQALDSKDREIAGLKKNATDTAEIWEEVVAALGMQDDLRETIKDIPKWCLERVKFIIGFGNAETERNEAYEKQITELQETTILRTEHEARVDEISKEKVEIKTQLNAETESVERLNVKLAEQESEIKQLNTEKGAQAATILSLRDEVKTASAMEKHYKDLYTQEYSKPFWRKFFDSLMGRPDLPSHETIEPEESPPKEATPVIHPEPKPDESEDEDAPEQSTP